jgi:hypothetical protein
MATPRSEKLNKPHVVGLQDQLLEVALGQLDDGVIAGASAAASTSVATWMKIVKNVLNFV